MLLRPVINHLLSRRRMRTGNASAGSQNYQVIRNMTLEAVTGLCLIKIILKREGNLKCLIRDFYFFKAREFFLQIIY